MDAKMSKDYINIEDNNPPNFKMYYYNQTKDTHLVFELVQVNPQSDYVLTIDCWSDLADPPFKSVVFSSFTKALKCVKEILMCKRLYIDKPRIGKLRSCIKNAIRGDNNE